MTTLRKIKTCKDCGRTNTKFYSYRVKGKDGWYIYVTLYCVPCFRDRANKASRKHDKKRKVGRWKEWYKKNRKYYNKYKREYRRKRSESNRYLSV